MPSTAERRLKPNLLCIVPPYATNCPPAGAAALLGYLKANDCHDFDFLDLRLGVPDVYAPTYRHTSAFAEAYVMDVPDLPLVLQLLDAVDRGGPFFAGLDRVLDRYCLERALSPDYVGTYLAGIDRYLEAVFRQLPRIELIGFSTWTSNYLTTLLAAAHLKRRKHPPFIVAGGPQVSESRASAALGLRSGLFDAVVPGEGEHTLLTLYTEFRRAGAERARRVPGTLYLETPDGQPRQSERRLLPLGSLPAPSFDEMHLRAYQHERDYQSLPYQLSRGCTDKCSFCSEWVLWERFRPDSPDHAVPRIQELQTRYDANFIVFTDSLLNGHPGRLVQFAEQLLQKSLDIQWGGFMRAQMDAETAALLKRAGCHDVFIGIESFSDETLALMNKRRTELENVQAIEAFLAAGIGVTAGFIPGFPGDTRDAFLHSAKMLRDFQRRFPGQLSINDEPFIVSPGQPLYSSLDELGLTPHPWDETYLDIASRYRDITSTIWCTVDGKSQGVERLGRLQIAAMVASDAPERSDLFDYEQSEQINQHQFAFDHLSDGWHLAQIKTRKAYVFALLVTQEEMEELVELSEALAGKDLLSHRQVVSVLSSIEREHIVRPSRRGPRIVKTHFRANFDADARYTVSPFLVARPMDWRGGKKILAADFVTGLSFNLRSVESRLLGWLADKPRSERQLSVLEQTSGGSKNGNGVRRTLKRLIREGAIVVCNENDRDRRPPSSQSGANSVKR